MTIQNPGTDQTQVLTPFQKSLKDLDKKIDWVPLGWQTAFDEFRSKLWSVDCPARANFSVIGDAEMGQWFALPREPVDPVLDRICKKFTARAASTCRHCGSPGKPRAIDGWNLSLCPTCFVRQDLKVGITKAWDAVAAFDYAGRVIEINSHETSDCMRVMLPNSVWRARMQTFGPGVIYTTGKDLREHQDYLQAAFDLANQPRRPYRFTT